MRTIQTFILVIALVFSFVSPAYALTQQDVELLIRAGLIQPEKVAAARAAVSGGSTQQTRTTTTQTAAGTDTSGCLALSTTLSEGMSGTAVTSLQQSLARLGYFTAGATGYFGAVTRKAVEDFQKAQGIVLNGAPETTGFGAVGPQTRTTIQKLTCSGAASINAGNASVTGSASAGLSGGSGDFFGYNLDELLDNYNADFEYEPSDEYDIDTAFDINFEYDPEFDFDFDFDYDYDFDYDFDNSYNPTFAYNPNFGSEGEAPIRVLFEVLATNGQYIAGGFEPVAVPSRDVTLRWRSENADSCFLAGDFVERSITVPEQGRADVYLVNPSYVIPISNDEGKAMFGFRLTCEEDETFGDSATGVLMLHIATSTESN